MEQHFGETQVTNCQAAGTSLALLVPPDSTSRGQFKVCDRYSPDDVTTLGELKERAQQWGCAQNLDSALSTLRYRLQGVTTDGAFPIVLMFIVHRPFRLIGESSDLELILYLFEVNENQSNWNERLVMPVAHRETITPKLLQQFSTISCYYYS